jgi:hypothetical protein
MTKCAILAVVSLAICSMTAQGFCQPGSADPLAGGRADSVSVFPGLGKPIYSARGTHVALDLFSSTEIFEITSEACTGIEEEVGAWLCCNCTMPWLIATPPPGLYLVVDRSCQVEIEIVDADGARLDLFLLPSLESLAYPLSARRVGENKGEFTVRVIAEGRRAGEKSLESNGTAGGAVRGR